MSVSSRVTNFLTKHCQTGGSMSRPVDGIKFDSKLPVPEDEDKLCKKTRIKESPYPLFTTLVLTASPTIYGPHD